MVLMATVTSFEGLHHPSKSELRQFAELFMPLFAASTPQAKREAVAALSQNPNVPSAVAFFIACQPISVSAPFLVSSAALDDETLIAVARTQGSAHARAIVRREDLSPTVIDALVGLRHARQPARPQPQSTMPPQANAPALAPARPDATATVDALTDSADALRRQLRIMARQQGGPAFGDTLGMRRLTEVQEALLIRFAREGNARQFCVTLSDSLSASHWLSERILLDISGEQLAVTLIGLGMAFEDASFALESFYPHLTARDGEMTQAEALLDQLNPARCAERIESWRRADSETHRRDNDGAAALATQETLPPPAMPLVVRR